MKEDLATLDNKKTVYTPHHLPPLHTKTPKVDDAFSRADSFAFFSSVPIQGYLSCILRYGEELLFFFSTSLHEYSSARLYVHTLHTPVYLYINRYTQEKDW